jgi:hypothetical protein
MESFMPESYMLQSPDESGIFDRNGQRLRVYDLVRVVDIPPWYLNEPNAPDLRRIFMTYKDCYGLITYNNWIDTDGVKRWFGTNNMFMVDVIKDVDNIINKYQFGLSGHYVERIPFNPSIMSLFVSYEYGAFSNFNEETVQKFTSPEVKQDPHSLQEISQTDSIIYQFRNIISMDYKDLAEIQSNP